MTPPVPAASTDALRELIERLEKAEGPSRELEDAIWAIASGYEFRWREGARPEHLVPKCFCSERPYHAEGAPHWRSFAAGQGGPHYLHSIDAALTLKPAEANCHGYDLSPNGVIAYFSRNSVSSGHWLIEGSHPTSPALALCIAALKARRTPSASPHEGDGR